MGNPSNPVLDNDAGTGFTSHLATKGRKSAAQHLCLSCGMIPVSLCFWYYRTLGDFSHDRVYFTYDHALFF